MLTNFDDPILPEDFVTGEDNCRKIRLVRIHFEVMLLVKIGRYINQCFNMPPTLHRQDHLELGFQPFEGSNTGQRLDDFDNFITKPLDIGGSQD